MARRPRGMTQKGAGVYPVKLLSPASELDDRIENLLPVVGTLLLGEPIRLLACEILTVNPKSPPWEAVTAVLFLIQPT